MSLSNGYKKRRPLATKAWDLLPVSYIGSRLVWRNCWYVCRGVLMDDFRRCEWCHRPFEYRLRTQSEQEMLKVRLRVSGEAALVERMICDPCYEKVITTTPNIHDPEVGGSNSGPSNLLLRKFG